MVIVRGYAPGTFFTGPGGEEDSAEGVARYVGFVRTARRYPWRAWPVLGFEQVRVVPGITRCTPRDFLADPMSLSLPQLVWGFPLGGVYFLCRRDLRTAMAFGTLLPAEWLLDYLAHRPDLSDPGLRRCPARAANERYG